LLLLLLSFFVVVVVVGGGFNNDDQFTSHISMMHSNKLQFSETVQKQKNLFRCELNT